MKTMRVGQWWNNFDGQQQAAFRRLASKGNVNDVRKFLTAAKRRFPAYIVVKLGVVQADGGRTFAFSSDRGEFVDMASA